MTFAEAIPLLLQGKTVARGTEISDYHYLLEDKKQGTLNWLKPDNSDFGYFILTRQDLEANDWEVVE